MSERTDHAARALAVVRHALDMSRQGEEAVISLAAAQVDATLALVEQQRIANLIALAAHAGSTHGVPSEAACSAIDGLIDVIRTSNDDEHVELTDDIKAALGIDCPACRGGRDLR